MTVLPQVQAAIRDLGARRLARAYLGLTALAALSLGEWLLSGLTARVALWSLAGVPFSALGLLGVAWRGVRRAGGSGADPAAVSRALLQLPPFVHGVFVLVDPGVRRMALGGFETVPTLLGLGYAFLGLRLLRDGVRVAEVGRLGAAMAVPAPEEGRDLSGGDRGA